MPVMVTLILRLRYKKNTMDRWASQKKQKSNAKNTERK